MRLENIEQDQLKYMRVVKFIYFFISIYIYHYIVYIVGPLFILICVNPRSYFLVSMTIIPLIVVSIFYKIKSKIDLYFKFILIILILILFPFSFYNAVSDEQNSLINYIIDWYQPWNHPMGRCWG